MGKIWNQAVIKIKYYGEAVMFSHTIFSLTFAILAMFAAADGFPTVRTILFILLALVPGRTGANAINRVIDKKYDAINERTKDRHLATGKLKSIELIILTIVCFLIFVYAAFKLNKLCFYLSPMAIALFLLYSYTKRFTYLCHLVLGFTCAGAPVGAWFAVTGAFSIIPFVLAAAVMLWIAGFDVIYATQDIEFDRKNKLYSIPQTFGLKNALLLAKVFHLVMIIILVAFGLLVKLSFIYYLGLMSASLLLLLQHHIVNPKDQRLMNIASYKLNQVISLIICIFGCIDILV